MSNQLPLHQEIALLSLSDRDGTFCGGMYLYATAGAMVSELLLQERIVAADDKKQTVAVVSDESTGDSVLDDLLQKISSDTKPRPLSHWISKAAGSSTLAHEIAGQLAELGIVEQDEKKVLWVFTKRIYPELDGSWEDAIRARMAGVMFGPEAAPDARTAVLIALASHGGLLKANFVPEELKQHDERIKELADGNILAAGATQETIRAVQAAVAAAAVIPAIVVATSAH